MQDWRTFFITTLMVGSKNGSNLRRGWKKVLGVTKIIVEASAFCIEGSDRTGKQL
jgi:hypothetical protein